MCNNHSLLQLSKPDSLRRFQRSFNAYFNILSEASTDTTSNPSSTNIVESILINKFKEKKNTNKRMKMFTLFFSAKRSIHKKPMEEKLEFL